MEDLWRKATTASTAAPRRGPVVVLGAERALGAAREALGIAEGLQRAAIGGGKGTGEGRMVFFVHGLEEAGVLVGGAECSTLVRVVEVGGVLGLGKVEVGKGEKVAKVAEVANGEGEGEGTGNGAEKVGDNSGKEGAEEEKGETGESVEILKRDADLLVGFGGGMEFSVALRRVGLRRFGRCGVVLMEEGGEGLRKVLVDGAKGSGEEGGFWCGAGWDTEGKIMAIVDAYSVDTDAAEKLLTLVDGEVQVSSQTEEGEEKGDGGGDELEEEEVWLERLGGMCGAEKSALGRRGPSRSKIREVLDGKPAAKGRSNFFKKF